MLDALGKRARGVEQRVDVGAYEHAAVPNRLDEFDRWLGDPHAELRHARAERPDLLDGDALPEPGEAREVSEADPDFASVAEGSGFALGAPDYVPRGLLTKVDAQLVLQHRHKLRRELLDGRHVTHPQLVLTVAGLDQSVADEQANRGGRLCHGLSNDTRYLQQLLPRQPGGEEDSESARRSQVLLGVSALSRLGVGVPERQQHCPQVGRGDAGLARDRGERVAPVTGQGELERQRRKPVLAHRLAQLLNVRAVPVAVAQKLAPSLVLGGVGNPCVEQRVVERIGVRRVHVEVLGERARRC